MTYKKLCAFCEKAFETENLKNNFCSNECYKKHTYLRKKKNRENAYNEILKKIEKLEENYKIFDKSFNNLYIKINEIDDVLTLQVRNIKELQDNFKCFSEKQNQDKGEKQNQITNNKTIPANDNQETSIQPKAENNKQETETENKTINNKIDKNKISPNVIIPENLEMLYCERMKAKATSLPCGLREQCWYPDKCKKNKRRNKPSDLYNLNPFYDR